jgi:hypothetical protein
MVQPILPSQSANRHDADSRGSGADCLGSAIVGIRPPPSNVMAGFFMRGRMASRRTRMHIESEQFHENDPDKMGQIHAFFGPQQVDNQIRHAIQTCWMALPVGRKNVDGVETEIRRIVDRALRDLREDYQSFGIAVDK